MCVSVSPACMPVCLVLKETSRGHRKHIGYMWLSLHVGAGNQAQVLCKHSDTLKRLSHLSSPYFYYFLRD